MKYLHKQITWRPGQNACKLLNKGQTRAAEFIFTSTYLHIEKDKFA